MELQTAIQNFTAGVAEAIVWGLGTAIGLTIAYVFVVDYLRKRAEASRKVWRNL